MRKRRVPVPCFATFRKLDGAQCCALHCYTPLIDIAPRRTKREGKTVPRGKKTDPNKNGTKNHLGGDESGSRERGNDGAGESRQDGRIFVESFDTFSTASKRNGDARHICDLKDTLWVEEMPRHQSRAQSTWPISARTGFLLLLDGRRPRFFRSYGNVGKEEGANHTGEVQDRLLPSPRPSYFN